MLLKNKNVLVTGGSRGIGRGIVIDLASKGANVFFTYLSSAFELVDSLVKEVETFGVKVCAYSVDASNYSASKDLVNVIIREVGCIDVLVNNVGITKDSLFLRLSEEDWDKVIKTNLSSVFSTTKAVVPVMLSNRQGSIINITSVIGICGNYGQANYAASKAGIIGFTKSLSKELGSRNIRCNAVAPGYIKTDMTESLRDDITRKVLEATSLKRFGSVEDIAKCVSFLASDDSKFITGQVIRVDGGLSI